MKNSLFLISLLFIFFVSACDKNEQQKIEDKKSLEISMQQIDDFLLLVEKTKGNPNALIYGGGRELFIEGYVLPLGFTSKFKPFLNKVEKQQAFYTFMAINSDSGSYWAKLEVDLTTRKIIKYDAMGFNVSPSDL